MMAPKEYIIPWYDVEEEWDGEERIFNLPEQLRDDAQNDDGSDYSSGYLTSDSDDDEDFEYIFGDRKKDEGDADDAEAKVDDINAKDLSGGEDANKEAAENEGNAQLNADVSKEDEAKENTSNSKEKADAKDDHKCAHCQAAETPDEMASASPFEIKWSFHSEPLSPIGDKINPKLLYNIWRVKLNNILDDYKPSSGVDLKEFAKNKILNILETFNVNPEDVMVPEGYQDPDQDEPSENRHSSTEYYKHMMRMFETFMQDRGHL